MLYAERRKYGLMRISHIFIHILIVSFSKKIDFLLTYCQNQLNSYKF